MGPVLLVGALKEEIGGIQRRMTVAEVITGQGFKLYRGTYQARDCLLVQTGPGRFKAETATRFVLGRFPVGAIVSFGFAGALTDELGVGDVVICSRLYYCNGGMPHAPGAESLAADANLLALATNALESGRARFCCGSSITVTQVLASPGSKEKLSEISRAYIADMESYWVASIAASEHIPCITIRAVSDARQDSLPPLDQLLAGDGSRPRSKTLSYFARHPQYLPRLPGLYAASRKARQRLTDCIAQVVAGMD